MRRWLFRAGLMLIVALAGALLLPDVRWWVWGRLRGEALYRWRPTSYWSLLVQEAVRHPGSRTWGVSPAPAPWWVGRAEKVLHIRLHGGPGLEGLAEDPAAVPVLFDLLADEDAQVRRAAASYLGRLGPRAEGAALPLARLLKDPEPMVREEARRALAGMGSAADPALPALRDALGDEDGNFRYLALSAIARIAQGSDTAVPVLAAALESDDERLREAAAIALGGLGRRAAPAVPALIRALPDPDERVRGCAAEALRGIRPTVQEAAEAGVP